MSEAKTKAGPRDYSGLRITADASLVPLLAPFAAECDIRYYLNGLGIEAAGDRPGLYLIATDGYRMMVAYDADGTIEGDDGLGVIIKKPPGLVSACRAKTKAGIAPYMVVQGGRLSVGYDKDHAGKETELYVGPGLPFIDGKFPDWRRVLPDFATLKPGFSGPVNAHLLASFSGLAPKKALWGFSAMRTWQAERNKQIVIQFQAHPNLVGILMPMRDGFASDGNAIDAMQQVVNTAREAA